MPDPAARARLMLAAAAVLWSGSGLFVRALQQPTPLGVESPALDPLHIALYRSLFAGLALLPLLRPADVRVRPAMVPLVLAFGGMTALYVSALGYGSAANAILLQNTAPVWVVLVGVGLLGDRLDRRSVRSIALGVLGAVVIVAGNWPRGPAADGHAGVVLLMGLGSGLGYALVILFLRRLRAESPVWLTAVNLVGSAAVVAGFVIARDGRAAFLDWAVLPSGRQMLYLAAFGCVQMAAPYVLFARGLRSVPPQEAGIITLLEPLLMPVWAYLIAPDRDTPTGWTLVGGALLLAALVWRYLPERRGRGV
jgi:drug/metabolite transporter (DMT)-like permease